jgi:hypothetical protein
LGGLRPTWRRLQLRADHVTALLASYFRIAQCDGYAADKHSRPMRDGGAATLALQRAI